MSLLLGLAAVVAWNGLSTAAPMDATDQLVAWKAARLGDISDTRFFARLSLAAAILVCLGGIVSSALQATSFRWVKGTTIALGVCLSVLTGLGGLLYPRDHQAMFRGVTRASKIVEELDMFLIEPVPQSKGRRQKFLKDYRATLARIDQALDSSGSNDSGAPPTEDQNGPAPAGADQARRHVSYLVDAVVPDASASQQETMLPGWVVAPPADQRLWNFVGLARAGSIQKAQKESLANARERAEQFMRQQVLSSATNLAPDFDLKAAASRIVRAGAVRDTFALKDESTEGYSYYTLFSIRRRYAAEEIAATALLAGASVPRDLQGKIESKEAPTESFAYELRRQAVYASVLDHERETLSSELYQRLQSARQSRKMQSDSEAIKQLEDFVAEAPRSYLGWYNLALAYGDAQMSGKAATAYQKALSLEPELPVRDPSVYAMAGREAMRSQSYQEAAKLLGRALELDPTHPYAKTNLPKAQAALATH